MRTGSSAHRLLSKRIRSLAVTESCLERRILRPSFRNSSTNHSQTMERTYENAIKIIESRQRRSRPRAMSPGAASSNNASPSGTPDLKGKPGIVGMSEWLQMLGYLDEDINKLNFIHIAGTKGKGSTCAFIESVLRAHGKRTGFPLKTGLYTSPHLILPQERIRIDSEPLAPPLFAKYLFEVYDKLPQLHRAIDPTKAVVERGPRSLQLYALLAFHTFIREKVDVAIFETHHGGEYDPTNVVKQPIVTAVTSLGMDHIQTLGPNIENIAWHKAGIYKQGAAALSTTQDSVPSKMLEKRARDNGETLQFIDEDPELPMDTLQLKPKVQKKNASLAVAVANAFLDRKAPPKSRQLTQEDIRAGIEQWKWPGRFQVIPDNKRIWFLDSAHNEMSVKIAAQWFYETGQELHSSASRVLIFSHISEHRDAIALLQVLAESLKSSGAEISHVIFTTYDESEERRGSSTAEGPSLFNETWRKVFPHTQISTEPTISNAIQLVEQLSFQAREESMLQILVTGSQHLIGPALRILEGT